MTLYGTKEVSNRDGRKLPRRSIEGACKTTSLDSFAWTWDTPEIFVNAKILTQDAKLTHYFLTTDQKENQLFFLNQFNDTGKGMKIKLKAFPESYELCEDTWKNVQNKFWNFFYELRRRFRNAIWRNTNKRIFILGILIFDWQHLPGFLCVFKF